MLLQRYVFLGLLFCVDLVAQSNGLEVAAGAEEPDVLQKFLQSYDQDVMFDEAVSEDIKNSFSAPFSVLQDQLKSCVGGDSSSNVGAEMLALVGFYKLADNFRPRFIADFFDFFSQYVVVNEGAEPIDLEELFPGQNYCMLYGLPSDSFYKMLLLSKGRAFLRYTASAPTYDMWDDFQLHIGRRRKGISCCRANMLPMLLDGQSVEYLLTYLYPFYVMAQNCDSSSLPRPVFYGHSAIMPHSEGLAIPSCNCVSDVFKCHAWADITEENPKLVLEFNDIMQTVLNEVSFDEEVGAFIQQSESVLRKGSACLMPSSAMIALADVMIAAVPKVVWEQKDWYKTQPIWMIVVGGDVPDVSEGAFLSNLKALWQECTSIAPLLLLPDMNTAGATMHKNVEGPVIRSMQAAQKGERTAHEEEAPEWAVDACVTSILAFVDKNRSFLEGKKAQEGNEILSESLQDFAGYQQPIALPLGIKMAENGDLVHKSGGRVEADNPPTDVLHWMAYQFLHGMNVAKNKPKKRLKVPCDWHGLTSPLYASLLHFLRQAGVNEDQARNAVLFFSHFGKKARRKYKIRTVLMQDVWRVRRERVLKMENRPIIFDLFPHQPITSFLHNFAKGQEEGQSLWEAGGSYSDCIGYLCERIPQRMSADAAVVSHYKEHFGYVREVLKAYKNGLDDVYKVALGMLFTLNNPMPYKGVQDVRLCVGNLTLVERLLLALDCIVLSVRDTICAVEGASEAFDPKTEGFVDFLKQNKNFLCPLTPRAFDRLVFLLRVPTKKWAEYVWPWQQRLESIKPYRQGMLSAFLDGVYTMRPQIDATMFVGLTQHYRVVDHGAFNDAVRQYVFEQDATVRFMAKSTKITKYAQQVLFEMNCPLALAKGQDWRFSGCFKSSARFMLDCLALSIQDSVLDKSGEAVGTVEPPSLLFDPEKSILAARELMGFVTQHGSQIWPGDAAAKERVRALLGKDPSLWAMYARCWRPEDYGSIFLPKVQALHAV